MEQLIGGDASSPPPRAFTQGVGAVFQGMGVTLFFSAMCFCCGAGVWSGGGGGSAVGWSQVGWGKWVDESGPAPVERPAYTASRAVGVCMVGAVLLGLAMAALGLGMQAHRRYAAAGGAVATGLGAGFWIVHFLFFVQILHAPSLWVVTCVLSVVCGLLCAMALAAAREVRRNPPAPGLERLPADYKIPYSHYHPDPPEVRLAREIELRRQRLHVQQTELAELEARVRLGRGGE